MFYLSDLLCKMQTLGFEGLSVFLLLSFFSSSSQTWESMLDVPKQQINTWFGASY